MLHTTQQAPGRSGLEITAAFKEGELVICLKNIWLVTKKIVWLRQLVKVC